MSTLISVFGYATGEPIQAIVSAQNAKGWSAFSDQSSGLNA